MDNRITIRYKIEQVDCYRSRSVESVEWQTATAKADLSVLDEFPHGGGLYEIGPYIAQIVQNSYNLVDNSVLVVKVDHPLGWLYKFKFNLSRLAIRLSARIVYMLAIWGFANMPRPGCYIGWYLVKERWS